MAKRLQRKLWLFAVGLLFCSSANGKSDNEGDEAIRNVSFIGVAVSAMCYCKQRSDFQLCSSWQFKDNTSTFYDKASEIASLQIPELRVYNNFVKHSLCPASVLGHKQTGRDSCATYLQITNQLYKDCLIEHSSAQNQSMDWSQCNNMCTSNIVGCNYTIAVVSKNCSEGSHPFIGDSLHYFASSFAPLSRHMQLGKLYRVSVYKYKRAADEVEISEANRTFPSSEPLRDDFMVSIKKPTQPAQKSTDGANNSDRQDPTLKVHPASSTARMVLPIKNLFILTLSSILIACFVN